MAVIGVIVIASPAVVSEARFQYTRGIGSGSQGSKPSTTLLRLLLVPPASPNSLGVLLQKGGGRGGGNHKMLIGPYSQSLKPWNSWTTGLTGPLTTGGGGEGISGGASYSCHLKPKAVQQGCETCNSCWDCRAFEGATVYLRVQHTITTFFGILLLFNLHSGFEEYRVYI